MKINLLIKRESFFEIFQKSTSDFLQEKYHDSSFTDIKYIVNDYLNIIYPQEIERNELVNLVSEFKYHSSLCRRTLQTIYAFLAIRWPIEIIASSKSILISMPINAKGWVFIPGNHSIRVVDIINNRCFVFLKSGFNVKFIESDANIRLKYQWLKAPKVIQKKACWYEEQRLVGLPWNRLSSDDLKKKVIIRAQNHLLMLYQKTTVKVSMKDYVSKISNSILIFLETNFSSLLNQEKDIIKNFVAELGILLNKYSSTVNIDLVCTHGDFQPGNILCTEDDFWIIDWEYSDQRSIYYDALVFDLESRFPAGLSRRFKNKINNLDFTNNYLIWVGKSLNSDKNYYFYVFFLEDLLLRLNELSVDLIYAKSEALSKYLSELLAIQGILKAQIKK